MKDRSPLDRIVAAPLTRAPERTPARPKLAVPAPAPPLSSPPIPHRLGRGSREPGEPSEPLPDVALRQRKAEGPPFPSSQDAPRGPLAPRPPSPEHLPRRPLAPAPAIAAEPRRRPLRSADPDRPRTSVADSQLLAPGTRIPAPGPRSPAPRIAGRARQTPPAPIVRERVVERSVVVRVEREAGPPPNVRPRPSPRAGVEDRRLPARPSATTRPPLAPPMPALPPVALRASTAPPALGKSPDREPSRPSPRPRADLPVAETLRDRRPALPLSRAEPSRGAEEREDAVKPRPPRPSPLAPPSAAVPAPLRAAKPGPRVEAAPRPRDEEPRMTREPSRASPRPAQAPRAVVASKGSTEARGAPSREPPPTVSIRIGRVQIVPPRSTRPRVAARRTAPRRHSIDAGLGRATTRWKEE